MIFGVIGAVVKITARVVVLMVTGVAPVVRPLPPRIVLPEMEADPFVVEEKWISAGGKQTFSEYAAMYQAKLWRSC